jgi:uncharacterized protein (DUF2147 family)
LTAGRYKKSLGGLRDWGTFVKILAAIVIGLLLAARTIAPAFAADPSGVWVTSDGGAQVRITNCGGALCGWIIWLREPNDPATGRPKIDKNNIDASKQNRPLLGVQIILGMRPSISNVWSGDIYNASDGKTYPGSFTITGDTAEIKGCVMGILCKSQTWIRAQMPLGENLTSGGEGSILVPLKKESGGAYVVPVILNNTVRLNYEVDSGASDVTVPFDVFSTLVRGGTIQKADFIGRATYTLADGSQMQGVKFTIRSLKVANTIVEDVTGSVAERASLLLGRSFLQRFKSWSIDNARHVLVLERQ